LVAFALSFTHQVAYVSAVVSIQLLISFNWNGIRPCMHSKLEANPQSTNPCFVFTIHWQQSDVSWTDATVAKMVYSVHRRISD